MKPTSIIVSLFLTAVIGGSAAAPPQRYTCSQGRNPCRSNTGLFFAHVQNDKYIECGPGDTCNVRDCQLGKLWDQATATCASSDTSPSDLPDCPYPSPCDPLREPGKLLYPYPYTNYHYIECGETEPRSCSVSRCPPGEVWKRTGNHFRCTRGVPQDVCPANEWTYYPGNGRCNPNAASASGRLQCEGEVAIHISNIPHVTTAQSQLMTFLGSTPRIKVLSRAAMKLNMAMEECQASTPLISCPTFLSLVETGQLCTEVSNAIDECPYETHVCDVNSRYRTIDGSCNNLASPLRGSAGRSHQRFLPPAYSDCVGAPRTGTNGPLPSARLVSNTVFRSEDPPISNVVTALHVIFGQITDHDIVETPVSTLQNPCTGELEATTCGDSGCETEGPENRQCFPIINPVDDDLFSSPPQPCQMFVRSEEVPNDECRPGPRQQANMITSYLDASFVYGSEDELAEELRTQVGGLLKTTPHPMNPNGNFLPLLPTLLVDEVLNCRNTTDIIKCFEAGDIRANDMVGLTALHTVYLRFHNYIAEQLVIVNPTWDDEALYQEARRLLIAVRQNINAGEYLPPLLGTQWMNAFNLFPLASGFLNAYDATLDASASNVLAAAALRFGHTQLPATTRFSDPTLTHQEEVFLTKLFFNPNRIYNSGILGGSISGVNALLIGLSDASASRMDNEFTDQIRGSLFTDNPAFGQGFDLTALNIQRAREHGVPGYVRWREWCNGVLTEAGLTEYLMTVPTGTDFDALSDNIAQSKIDSYKLVYDTVEDIDIFVGGISENPITGGLIGTTFACIVATDFHNKKFGDRFYYENQSPLFGFTEAQLTNIREQTLASLLCKTLEDDLDDPALTLTFQDHVLMKPRAQAQADLIASGVTGADLAAYLGLFETDNVRKPCEQHPEIDFRLFAA